MSNSEYRNEFLNKKKPIIVKGSNKLSFNLMKVLYKRDLLDSIDKNCLGKFV